LKKRILTLVAMTILSVLLLLPGSGHAKGIVLNFSDVDISTMVKFISDLTGKNFIMDERVKGKISVFSPSKISTDEAFSVFASVLELKGFAVVKAGKFYKILPSSDAKQSGMKLYTGTERVPVKETYVAQVIPLTRMPSKEAENFLKPVVSKDGYVASFGPANSLLVVDSAPNIQKILDIVKAIDSDLNREGAELVFLQHASADNIAGIVQEWLFGRDQTTRTNQQSQGGSVGGLLVPDARLNAVIIFGSEKDKADIKKLIALVDVVPPTSSSKINVYYLENADATEVSKVLEGMFKTTATATAAATAARTGAPAECF